MPSTRTTVRGLACALFVLMMGIAVGCSEPTPTTVAPDEMAPAAAETAPAEAQPAEDYPSQQATRPPEPGPGDEDYPPPPTATPTPYAYEGPEDTPEAEDTE